MFALTFILEIELNSLCKSSASSSNVTYLFILAFHICKKFSFERNYNIKYFYLNYLFLLEF